ncbi:hypothetical protein ACYPKM_35310 [Pseudomonas aeruginosa]
MNSLAGLNKGQRPEQTTPEVNTSAVNFIKSAQVSGHGVKYQRTNLSLDEYTNGEIDRMSLIPRTVRASRSDIVKVAVALLASQPDEVVARLVEEMKRLA